MSWFKSWIKSIGSLLRTKSESSEISPPKQQKQSTEGLYEEKRQKALVALEKNDAKGAFQELKQVISYPNLPIFSPHFESSFALFKRIVESSSGPELSSYVGAVVENSKDPQTLYDLGFQLIEYKLPQIAATVLARAYHLLPESRNILSELSVALEMSQLHQAAYEFLKATPEAIKTDFLCCYLLAFNSLMTMRIEEARELLPRLMPLLGKKEGKRNSEEYMLEQLRQMLVRADNIRSVSKLDGQDLRGWHFVITGGLLLHLSAAGFDEGMNGRYAWIQDQESLCLEGIKRLRAVLDHIERIPPQIFLLEDRDSAILAHAIAGEFQLPLTPWPKEGTEEPGLIVVYDLNALPENYLQQFTTHRPGQILFCHAVCFTQDFPITADVMTYFYQFNNTPWGERTFLSQDQKQLEKQPPIEGPAEEVAKTILASSVLEEDLADLPGLLSFAEVASQLRGEASLGLFQTQGIRRRQRTDSPVKSNHFD